MNEKLLIRHPNPEEIPMLEQIWMDVFGDPPELIEAFFDAFAPGACGWIVCCGTEILSTAYLLHGNVMMDQDTVKGALYVYAVASPSKYRGGGYGGMLMRHFAELAEQRDLLLYTRPANVGLFHWYADQMKTVPAYPREERITEFSDVCESVSAVQLSAEEYGRTRERLLSGKPHIVMSEAFLTLQELFLRSEKGGLFSVGNGVCACEVQGDTLVIKELITRSRSGEVLIIQSMLRHFSCRRAKDWIETKSGSPAVAYSGRFAPIRPNWGLLLD